MPTSTTQTEPTDASNLQHLHNLSASLDTLRQSTTLTDVFVECEGRKFPAHRLVLSAVSPYFKRAFEKEATVVLPNVSAQSMETILGFLYRGTIEDIRGDYEDMAKLLLASHQLQIEELIKFSFESLADHHLNTNKFYEIYRFVENLKNDYCDCQFITFLAKNFNDVVKSKDFLLLQGNVIKKILQCEKLYKTQIEDVIVGILKWAEFERPREQLLGDLFQTFDLRCCLECLKNVVQKNICVNWSPAVAATLLTLNEILASRTHENATKQQKLYCFGHTVKRQVMCIFDVENWTWLPCIELSFSLEKDMAVVSSGHHLYFFGGCRHIGGNINVPSSTFIQYCPFSNTVLDSGQNLLTPVFQAGAGVLNDVIYVVNGLNAVNTPILQVVQRYNISECIWDIAASTQEGHGMPFVFSFNQFLYVIGTNVSTKNCMERYDPLSDQWTVMTKIPGGIFYHKATFYGTKVIVVQEYNETEYHIYDLFLGDWLVRAFEGRPPQMKGLWAMTKNGKALLLICDNENVLHTCDLDSGSWLQRISQPKDDSCNLIYFVQS